MSDVLYLDASAIVKLVAREPESEALIDYLADRPERATSIVGAVESRRIGRVRGPEAVERLHFILSGVDVIDLDVAVAEAAAVVGPGLRTLDAIHLASALALGTDLLALVTYDNRLAGAARAVGLEVESPA